MIVFQALDAYYYTARSLVEFTNESAGLFFVCLLRVILGAHHNSFKNDLTKKSNAN